MSELKFDSRVEDDIAVNALPRRRYTHPGCFDERVRIWLIAKEFTFFATTKSPEQCERAGFTLRAVAQIEERSLWRRCEFSGTAAGKGVSGAGEYFMGYYTIWLAPVKRFFRPVASTCLCKFGEGFSFPGAV